MKMTIIGGASSNVPLIIKSIINKSNGLLNEIVLYDIDKGNLLIIYNYCLELIKYSYSNMNLNISYNLKEACKDSDIIVTYYRKGNLELRMKDQNTCIRHNILGQETQGAMGIISAYRQLSVLEKVCDTILKKCPNALLINISNPVNVLTKASKIFRIKAVGICELPWRSYTAIKKLLINSTSNNNIKLSWSGINHISWITSILMGNKNIIKEFYSKYLERFYSLAKPKNIPEYPHQLNNKNIQIPSPYLFYYYNRSKAFNLQYKKKIRSQQVIKIRDNLMECYKAFKSENIDKYSMERGGYLIGEALINFLFAYFSKKEMFFPGINIQNNGLIPFLGHDDIVELSVNCNNKKIVPFMKEVKLNNGAKGIIQAITSSNNIIIEAYLQKDLELLVEAMSVHPLVGDIKKSRNILNELKNTL